MQQTEKFKKALNLIYNHLKNKKNFYYFLLYPIIESIFLHRF